MPDAQYGGSTWRRLDACFVALLLGAPLVDAVGLLVRARFTVLDGGVLLLAVVSLVCWLIGRNSRGSGLWLHEYLVAAGIPEADPQHAP